MSDTNKIIIGYKLIKPEYADSVKQISCIETINNPVEYINDYFSNKTTGNFLDSLRKAGVLDLWFEPVYEELYKEGDYIFLSKSGGRITGPIIDGFCRITTIGIGKFLGTLYHGKYKNYYVINNDSLYTTDNNDSTIRKATPEEIKSATKIKINGYTSEFFTNQVKFGCKIIDLIELKALKSSFEILCNLQGLPFSSGRIAVDIEGKFEITYDLVCKCIDRIENK